MFPHRGREIGKAGEEGIKEEMGSQDGRGWRRMIGRQRTRGEKREDWRRGWREIKEEGKDMRKRGETRRTSEIFYRESLIQNKIPKKGPLLKGDRRRKRRDIGRGRG